MPYYSLARLCERNRKLYPANPDKSTHGKEHIVWCSFALNFLLARCMLNSITIFNHFFVCTYIYIHDLMNRTYFAYIWIDFCECILRSLHAECIFLIWILVIEKGVTYSLCRCAYICRPALQAHFNAIWPRLLSRHCSVCLYVSTQPLLAIIINNASLYKTQLDLSCYLDFKL